ncbi:phosphoglycerate mutase, putative [Entamoeba invadens IP1]|uniref:phosphoglycerate mutase, putative n=1 Tax=Entamoeba invadens IP1 TaxID=370355 RepID=UPI0002C3D32D|nr:phosphoglycerate mutase, putative [Entamoeba invadens IP1]ELP90503.1 phosphoglycerate mutase, putative [Entamoeba invadens IP1]|eukprot:XP_004257274.1 phosphoglycerate mutase, putative [Entamoeba invadens IP1]
MTTTLIFVRHGETEWNNKKVIQGCTDIPLSEKGRQQAFELSKRIPENVDVIYTSPLKRALETANIISEGKEVVISQDLIEPNFGSWEGKEFNSIGDMSAKEFVECTNGIPLGDAGNTVHTLSQTILGFLNSLVQTYENKTVMLVSHGTWIKCALVGILEFPDRMYHQLGVCNASVTTVVYRKGYYCMTHLSC